MRQFSDQVFLLRGQVSAIIWPTCQAFPKRLRLRAAYRALSPPLRKLRRSIVPSSPVPSGIGDTGRDKMGRMGGAWGSSVSQISHFANAGWFKKVHAGQAISFGRVPGAAGGEEDRCTEDGGAEAARGGVGVVAELALGRGTPQSAHFAAVGLEPGGLRKSHTSHCQPSPRSSPSVEVAASAADVKYSVALGDDLKIPA